MLNRPALIQTSFRIKVKDVVQLNWLKFLFMFSPCLILSGKITSLFPDPTFICCVHYACSLSLVMYSLCPDHLDWSVSSSLFSIEEHIQEVHTKRVDSREGKGSPSPTDCWQWFNIRTHNCLKPVTAGHQELVDFFRALVIHNSDDATDWIIHRPFHHFSVTAYPSIRVKGCWSSSILG